MSTKNRYTKLGLPALAASTASVPYQDLLDNPPEGWSEEESEVFANSINQEPAAPSEAALIESGGINLSVGGYREGWGYSMQDPLAIRTSKVIGYWDVVRWPSNLTKAQAVASVKIRIERTCSIEGSQDPTCTSSANLTCGDCIGGRDEDINAQRNLGWNGGMRVIISVLGSDGGGKQAKGHFSVRFLMAPCESFRDNKLVGQRRDGTNIFLCDTLRYIHSVGGSSKMIKFHNDRLKKDSFNNIVPDQNSPQSTPGWNGGFLFTPFNGTTDTVTLFTTNNKEASGRYAN